ncbi:ATP-dependent DNA helicase [Bogoriella caseilytica]|uniref:DNA 3'-5' helicase n=1 Tax=Bogoriella caseilytica TaxID=56055 RepID=A0A3N2BEP8_9MICO|nr:ATP-dependent DNA helicase [Bogoriella caseilytica]ROR73712.1 DNA helicase-2/ATP-dependent DNA helicase PcrA [Bogoriella caseilytica]
MTSSPTGAASTSAVPETYSPRRIAEILGQHPPTAEQEEVIRAGHGPVLVVAGAGSGKTETMAARVVYLVANGVVRPEEVLGLTFTRKAAAELSQRIRARLSRFQQRIAEIEGGEADQDALAHQPEISTYNSFAAAVAAEHALRVGGDPDAALLTDAGAWQLADRALRSWQDDLATTRKAPALTTALLGLAAGVTENVLSIADARELLEDLLTDLSAKSPAPGSRSKGPAKDVAAAISALAERRELLDLVEAVEQRKRELGLVTFADQVALAARVARQVPEAGAQLRHAYRVVLLDEFQDTSVAQLDFLSHLFGTASGESGHSVTAVGDPNQAIYGWRGASAASLKRFREQFTTADGAPAPTLDLTTAWRNDHGILRLANAVAAPLRATSPFAVRELTARPGAGPGHVRAALASTQPEEAEEVAAFLEQHWRRGQDTAAVLCRNRAQFRPLIEVFEARGVPYRVLGLGGLLTCPEVLDLRAALRVIDDAGRGDQLVRLLTSLNLGAADLHALAGFARSLGREVPLVEALDALTSAEAEAGGLSAAATERVLRLAGQLRRLRGLTQLALPELVRAAEQILGVDLELTARYGPAGRSRLDAFAEVAAGYAQDAAAGALRPTLGAFLDWLDAATEHERGLEGADIAEDEPETDVVQLLTIHAAKGLEWDVVAVPGLVEKQFPNYASKPQDDLSVTDNAWLTSIGELPYPLRQDAADLPSLDVAGAATHQDVAAAREEFRQAAGAHRLSEETRLAYVALTRAKRAMLVSASHFRAGKTPLPPSRFLLAASRLADECRPWAEAPEDGAENPALESERAEWVPDVLGARRPAVEKAARAVLSAEPAELSEDSRDPVVDRWRAEARLLLAERDTREPEEVAIAGRLSASAMMSLMSDPAGFALQRRRPVPAKPTVGARRGTRFHAWIQEYYHRAALIDAEDIISGVEEAVPSDADLVQLREHFAASPWAQRTPVAIETDLLTPVGGTIVRCRIDAVFPDHEHPGGFIVVDWKTGRPPVDAQELAVKEMQLALYRLAWARERQVPLEQVRAAFQYIGHDEPIYAGMLTEDEIVERLAVAAGRPD